MNTAGHQIISAVTPTLVLEPALAVGWLWSDTFAGTVKVCTSISPVTFVSISGGGGGTPGGSDGQIQFNDGGAFGGFGDWDAGLSTLSVDGIFNLGETPPDLSGYDGNGAFTIAKNSIALINLVAAVDDPYNYAGLTGYSSRGTVAAPTDNQNGDIIGFFDFLDYHNGAYNYLSTYICTSHGDGTGKTEFFNGNTGVNYQTLTLEHNNTFLSGGIFGGTLALKASIPAFDASTYTPVLAGAGAGNVSNGTHRYKFTFTDAAGTPHETDGSGAPTPAVTVVNNAVNGKVTVPIPAIYATNYPIVNIYRDKNSDGVYKFVAASVAFSIPLQSSIEDNVADGSLGAVIPSTNNTLAARLQWDGETLSSEYDPDTWGSPLVQLDGGGEDGFGFSFVVKDTQTSHGNDFYLFAGNGGSGRGGGLLLGGGGASNGTAGAVISVFGGSLTDAGSLQMSAGSVVSGATGARLEGYGAAVSGGGGGGVVITGGTGVGSGNGGEVSIHAGQGADAAHSNAVNIKTYDSGNAVQDTIRAIGDQVTIHDTLTAAGVIKGGGYKSSDDSVGISTTITAASLATKTITVKNGLITDFS